MTNTEFINELDIKYNNIRSNSAPGIDLYEWSVLLTQAQEQILFNYFNSKSNPKQEGFENSEKRRRDLEKLVKGYNTSDVAKIEENTNLLFDGLKSYFIEIPENVFFITQEKVTLSPNKQAIVIPISHDELMLQNENPFRKPNSDLVSTRAWRMDNTLGSFEESVEIVIPDDDTIATYQMRYVEKPEPIVLTTLDSGEFTGMGLSIDGYTTENPCKLNSIVHRQILDRAVDIAIETFEKSRIQTHPAMASRNE